MSLPNELLQVSELGIRLEIVNGLAEVDPRIACIEVAFGAGPPSSERSTKPSEQRATSR